MLKQYEEPSATWVAGLPRLRSKGLPRRSLLLGPGCVLYDLLVVTLKGMYDVFTSDLGRRTRTRS